MLEDGEISKTSSGTVDRAPPIDSLEKDKEGFYIESNDKGSLPVKENSLDRKEYSKETSSLVDEKNNQHAKPVDQSTTPQSPKKDIENSSAAKVIPTDARSSTSQNNAEQPRGLHEHAKIIGPEPKSYDRPTLSSSSNCSTLHEPKSSAKAKVPTSQDTPRNNHNQGGKASGISEWSHNAQVSKTEEIEEEDEWQVMPSYASYDIYDDDNRLIAKEKNASDDEDDVYAGLGGAGRGYTRVQVDEDAMSATSLDENTKYLFKDVKGTDAGEMEDDEKRDAPSQMQATKGLLTESQRIAYVGMTRLLLSDMVKRSEGIISKGAKKETTMAAESMMMWSQKMMVRLYAHMEISAAEQIMIEQLSEHGVVPADLTPTLLQNARIKNPMAKTKESRTESFSLKSPGYSTSSLESPLSPSEDWNDEEITSVLPPYQEHEGDDLPEVRTPSQLPRTANLDIDLRWTVLCDLFLTLIADSVYDARSRTLLEKVGSNMGVDWLEICKFEKRVTDALEMQQQAEKENWNEEEHKETRRKMALNKRYLMMGLATVGGSLVIGLSAGLLAPVIGAGLAAGFTTVGVGGTSGFLAGAGGAAIITSGAAASGGIIAVRAADRRTGAVKTFEYRPLHNNKRVNLIVTVAGWMTGKVDDVRLPYSTVDPIMGDIYSVLWEPEMLKSMGDTINILATEALTQGLQQVLGSTILISLMAALQLPVVLTKLAYLIDNPWTVSLDRANSAGLILADSLIDRNLGTRPITLVGYSLGSRVIFSCLKELSRKGAFGLVQNVYLFGSPVVAKQEEFLKVRSVIAGRFVNGYSTNDWILGYLFRLTSGGISRVAGLAPVEDIPHLENLNVTELVPGHMSYRSAMPRLLREVGWSVESDEFTEIEDPDPENHQQRQRELINEIEEARKELERKEKERERKGKFGFFNRKKKAFVQKADWETYEESKPDAQPGVEDASSNNTSGLFNIKAIRAELASEKIEVRELKSTLPPMKLDLQSPQNPNPGALNSTIGEDKPYKWSSSPNLFDTGKLPTNPTPLVSDHIRGKSNSPDFEEFLEGSIKMTFDTSYRSFSNGSLSRGTLSKGTLAKSPDQPFQKAVEKPTLSDIKVPSYNPASRDSGRRVLSPFEYTAWPNSHIKKPR
ncbi:putative membrane protein [Podosphaera aphanis]|nr:putative membrane protein [Podosphaera aphanis]